MSLTESVKFSPRRMQTPCGMTPAQVKAHLAAKGVKFTVGADEFKVRLASQKADEAYCTEDLGDALATGLAMVA